MTADQGGQKNRNEKTTTIHLRKEKRRGVYIYI